MKEKLKVQMIYDDFVHKVILSDDEKKILDMYLKDYSYVKISLEMHMSDRNVGKILTKIKTKYELYKKLELAKLNAFLS